MGEKCGGREANRRIRGGAKEEEGGNRKGREGREMDSEEQSKKKKKKAKSERPMTRQGNRRTECWQ